MGLGLTACQFKAFAAEETPIVIPTRLVLPTPTTSAGAPTPSSAPQPSAVPQVDAGPTAETHSLTATPTTTFTATVRVFPTVDPNLPTARPGKYSRRAKGIELDEFTGKVDPTQLRADFGVIHGGTGWSRPFPNYEANIQALYQANIPILLLWDINLPPGFDASRPDKSFPPENEEPNVAAIIRATRNKAVAGIIISFLNKTTPEGKVFTQGWMANYITWMVKAVAHQTGKPLFVLTSQEFISGFVDAPELDSVIANLDGLCSWKSAAPGQTPQLASWNAFPLPGDDYVPEYLSDNTPLYFINYARTSWKFDGIDAPSTPLWMYQSTAAQLKKDLGYKEHDPGAAVNPTPTVSG